MEDYKPNSNRFKAENAKSVTPPEKKVEKIISTEAKVKKKGELAKAKDLFISEDVNNIKTYVVMDVLVPAIKKAISDIVTNGIEMLLYGETGASRRSSTSSNVSYRSYYDQRNRGRDTAPVRAGYNFDDIILNSRGEAEEVIARMDELIDTYGMVTVADLYDLVGITCNYTDNKYGWTNIRTAEPVRVRDGYMIKLPKAMPIN